MKIVCPSCDAMYEVPEAVVTSRRKMRCARCSRDWVPADRIAAASRPAAAPVVPVEQPVSVAAPAAALPAAAVPPDLPPAASSTGYVLVDSVPEPAAIEPEIHQDARREEEPYQLALRPETHLSVFPDRDAAPVFGTARAVTGKPAAQGVPILAWVLSVVVLLGVIGGSIMFRDSVMKAWPPSQRLYAALGLTQAQ